MAQSVKQRLIEHYELKAADAYEQGDIMLAGDYRRMASKLKDRGSGALPLWARFDATALGFIERRNGA